MNPRTIDGLEYFVSICDFFQKIRIAPKRYFVTVVAENTRFNAKLYIDLMHIEGAPVFHMIDDVEHFSSAKFVQPLISESV